MFKIKAFYAVLCALLVSMGASFAAVTAPTAAEVEGFFGTGEGIVSAVGAAALAIVGGIVLWKIATGVLGSFQKGR